MHTAKKISLLSLAMLLALFPAFSFGGKAPQVAVGHIKYYGNAPFEFPGFETADGYVYTLEVAENAGFSLADLANEQGNTLELTGDIDTSRKNGLNVLKDGVFIVTDWKRL